jgi:hypothetical protein
MLSDFGLEICQWCGEPCFAGAEVSLDVYLLQNSQPYDNVRLYSEQLATLTTLTALITLITDFFIF